MARCPAQREYVPRATQECDALVLVREHLPGFLERLETEGQATLPAFVRAELEAFTTCGDFEQGFLLLGCRHCGEQLRVPFSCKGRGVCPSCMGRRMCETAALLVDHRLPAVPYRQWVLSFPGPLAVRLGYDTELLGQVCRRFATRVMQALRRQVKHEHDLATSRALHPGVLVVVQRFRSDLGLFVHLHTLVTDGAFEERPDASPRFLSATQLREDHLVRVLESVAKDLATALDEPPPESDAGIRACVQLGNRRQLRLALDAPRVTKPMTVAACGMQLHAATTVHGRDRRQLERLCRYLLRPPFAQDAVKALPDGQVRVFFKQPSRHGATFTDLSRDTFLARLAALVPPPRFNLVRYYGVLANRHKLRPFVVPSSDADDDQPRQLSLFEQRAGYEVACVGALGRMPDRPPSRVPWAKLLSRVFQLDISTCPKCQGPMRMLDAVTDPDKIARHLHGARAPPRPRPPQQLVLLAG